MPRWATPQRGDEIQTPNGDSGFVGMDMKSKDPASMKPGFYREGYNVRVENGGMETRLGSLCPGALNTIQYNTIFGVGLFSNPNGLEWMSARVAYGHSLVADT